MSTTESPTISVVITAHDQKLDPILWYLRKQTKQPDEVIICYSDTDCPDIGDIKVHDINRNDWGHTKRDIGLRLATKDYVTFWNADDTYDPQFLEKLSAHPEDLIFCDFDHMGLIIESYPSMGTITSGNFIIKRELAQSVGWNHRHYEADGRFIMDVMERFPSYKHVNELLYWHK